MAVSSTDASVELGAALSADLASAALGIARRFAAGATMWCLAPLWPEHARHVAVEFVHPVIMGKRALPAIAVDESDLVAALRPVVRPGDVLVAVAPADAATVAAVMRRADAWGVTTVWIGAGPRPPAGLAHHVLWVGDRAAAPYDGSLVLVYHVLWELTHVCFEHPGLLGEPELADCDGEVCITCSDEGRLAEVVVAEAGALATVRSARGTETIDTTMVGPVGPGDLVLVHAGAAITVVDDGA